MSSVYEISLLLDFYGQLLTERQVEVLDLHYNQDLSLGEISENLKISRQGVHDAIKKGREHIIKFENKLGLAKRFLDQSLQIKSIMGKLGQLAEKNPKLVELKEIQQELKSLVEGL